MMDTYFRRGNIQEQGNTSWRGRWHRQWRATNNFFKKEFQMYGNKLSGKAVQLPMVEYKNVLEDDSCGMQVMISKELQHVHYVKIMIRQRAIWFFGQTMLIYFEIFKRECSKILKIMISLQISIQMWNWELISIKKIRKCTGVKSL